MNPFIRYALEKEVVKRMHPNRSTRGENSADTRNSQTTSESEIHPKYPLEKCILLDMADEEDTILFNFLEELKKHCKNIDDRDAREYVIKVEELKARSVKKTLEEKQKELEKEFDDVSYFVYDKLPTYKNPMKDSEIEYIKKFTIRINGVGISDESKTIEEEIALKQEKYQELNEKISEFKHGKLKELEERNAELKKQKDKLEQSLRKRFSRGSKEKKKAKLDEIKHKIWDHQNTFEWWDKIIKDAEKTKNDIEMLQNLKPDQIKLIDDFLKVKDEMDKFPREECFELDCHIRDIYCYDRAPMYYNGSTCGNKEVGRRKFGTALEEMIEDKSVSEEEIGYVIDKIGKIKEKRQNLEYNEYKYKYYELDEDLTKLIGLFLYELEEEYKLEKKENAKLVTSKDIAESSKQEKISLTEVNDARVTASRILSKGIFGDKGERL